MELGCNCHGVRYAAPPITYCLLQLYYIFTVISWAGLPALTILTHSLHGSARRRR